VTDDLVKRLRSHFLKDQVKDNPTFVASTYAEEREEAADRIEQLEAALGSMKAAFRVNMLRFNASHEEIDAVISAAIVEKKDG